MADTYVFDGIELTRQEAYRLHRWTDEGFAYWSWKLLAAEEFNPVDYARHHGDDGRKEGPIVKGLVSKGLIKATDRKGVYRFTTTGLRWLFLWRQSEHNYPLPWQFHETPALPKEVEKIG